MAPILALQPGLPMIDFAIGFGVGFAGAALGLVAFVGMMFALWVITWRNRDKRDEEFLPPAPPV